MGSQRQKTKHSEMSREKGLGQSIGRSEEGRTQLDAFIGVFEGRNRQGGKVHEVGLELAVLNNVDRL